MSSDNFTVRSFRDGKGAEAIFKKGNFVSYKEFDTKEANGTFVSFNPDPEVFKNGEIGYSYEKICSDIKDISYLYSGITFTISCGKEKKTFCAKNGIVDFVKENNKKPLHQHIITNTVVDDNGDKVEIAFQWGDGKEEGYVFVNGLRCPEGGTPVTGLVHSTLYQVRVLTAIVSVTVYSM